MFQSGRYFNYCGGENQPLRIETFLEVTLAILPGASQTLLFYLYSLQLISTSRLQSYGAKDKKYRKFGSYRFKIKLNPQRNRSIKKLHKFT